MKTAKELQDYFVNEKPAFCVMGINNWRTFDIEFFIDGGNVYRIDSCGKGYSIQRTKRGDWNEETRRFDYLENGGRVHIENRKGLKAFREWVDTLKPFETGSFFTTEYFNH